MKLVERAFKLEGEQGLGRYPRPDLIGPLLTHLPETLQDSVRMEFLHSSRPSGRVADTLKQAAAVNFVGVDAANGAGTFLVFRVPQLGDAAPEYFRQDGFWEEAGPRPEATAFDLLGAALIDVRSRQEDSTHFDRPFLRRLVGYRRLLKKGILRISLEDTQYQEVPSMDNEVLNCAEEMARVTPPPRRVRVAGRLDLMGASQGLLKLHVSKSAVVMALWSGEGSIDAHRELFNQDVVLEGLGVFRPSGSLLRIEADAIRPMARQDEFFQEVPSSPPVHDYRKLARLKPGEPSGYSAIRGCLPAGESDEEFIAALENLR